MVHRAGCGWLPLAIVILAGMRVVSRCSRGEQRENGNVAARRLTGTVAFCTVLLTGCGSQVAPGQYFGGGAAAAAQTGAGAANAAKAPIGEAPGAVGLVADTPSPASSGVGPGTGPGGSSSQSTPGQGPSSRPPTAGITAGSCIGFHNSTGINSSTISIGNVADVSGPVPGLFSSAQQATLAYAAYFNATSSICGRKLKVIPYDSETSASGDQQANTSACSETFAMVGSIGAFDSGGAQTASNCGIPDLRSISTTPERNASSVSFGTDAGDPTQVSTAQYRYIKSATGNAYLKTAVLYLDAGAATPNATAYAKTMTSLGYHVVYTQPIDVTSFNYAPYVAQMQSLGVTLVQFEGSYQFAVRLKDAMHSQGLNPVFVMDSVAYDPVFVQAGGREFDGMYSYVDTALVEDATQSTELKLYTQWLHQVAPSATPSFFGMFAWGSMALFAQLAVELGGKLTRASLLNAVKGVDNFTDHGLFAPQHVGSKRTTACQTVIQLENGRWIRRTPYPYICSTVFDTKN
jgi:ABC-type branched-subunit amino acid transport system substrate-binding protein